MNPGAWIKTTPCCLAVNVCERAPAAVILIANSGFETNFAANGFVVITTPRVGPFTIRNTSTVPLMSSASST
ncbi:MAG TPA: hypothetical protein VK846_00300 [Candidatus Limnocylindria bacterium]|nr:hypothetical protein [Candidatus Limnocylindria bacterium]